jgi:hypothetical protein
VGVLVDQVQALFPKVDGEVIEVQNGTVTLALGSKDGLVAGVELALYRQGRELKHPKTGEILGRNGSSWSGAASSSPAEVCPNAGYSTGFGRARAGRWLQDPGDRARISAREDQA